MSRRTVEAFNFGDIQARTSGHFRQARFCSCPMDERHCWFALAYVERNPIRAGLAGRAEDFLWPSAPAQLGGPDCSGILDDAAWAAGYDPEAWRTILSELSHNEALERRIRESTRTGRPLGDEAFVTELEQAQGRMLRPKARGGFHKRVSPVAGTAKGPACTVPV